MNPVLLCAAILLAGCTATTTPTAEPVSVAFEPYHATIEADGSPVNVTFEIPAPGDTELIIDGNFTATAPSSESGHRFGRVVFSMESGAFSWRVVKEDCGLPDSLWGCLSDYVGPGGLRVPAQDGPYHANMLRVQHCPETCPARTIRVSVEATNTVGTLTVAVWPV